MFLSWINLWQYNLGGFWLISSFILSSPLLLFLCSFSSNKCGLVADKKNHHQSHKTAPIYIYIYICNKRKITAKSHTELHYSQKPCWYDFVENTISGTFIWNNWLHVQFVLNCNKHFRFLLDKYSLLSKKDSLFSMFLSSNHLPISKPFPK